MSVAHVRDGVKIFGAFPNLATLYLQGNRIGTLAHVRRLSPLTTLRSLALHGNPIENRPDYRSAILSAIPWLRQLDFATITKQEREDLTTKQQRRVSGGGTLPRSPS
jgi:Leucine-rich repeat (LRR) protein